MKSKAKSSHREPKHFVSNKNKCTVSYLCPCVFFESFRRNLNEAKAVSCNVVNYLLSSVNISHPPLCKYDAPITSQVSSKVVNYLREPSLLSKNHFKSQDTKICNNASFNFFFQKSIYSGEKRISESRIFVFKFPGCHHLE